jgi:hypothetical protein
VVHDLYQFLLLQVGETHFRFKGDYLAAQSYLCRQRKHCPELRERQFSCRNSRTGVIVARLK